MQVFLCLAHWFIYHTWICFMVHPSPGAVLALRCALIVMAFSFIAAALLSFRFSNFAVALLYKVAAVWLGFLNFFFLAACLSWMAWYALLLTGLSANPTAARPLICGVLSALAVVACIYGLLNARWIRVRQISVELPGLPASWLGRTAVLLSDLHLGHVNGAGFARRVVRMTEGLSPDIVFIPGDLFDGTGADPHQLTAPFKRLSPAFGIFFASGNHDEFGSMTNYAPALHGAGIQVLNNERTSVDGLHVLGVSFGDSTYPIRMRSLLEAMRADAGEASILLNHVPSRLPIVEQAGVSLQLSGHTHGGQVFPFSWLTRRVFGKFTYGLQRFGALQVYTSSGAGTWGPPMRVGTHPEIVLLTFK